MIRLVGGFMRWIRRRFFYSPSREHARRARIFADGLAAGIRGEPSGFPPTPWYMMGWYASKDERRAARLERRRRRREGLPL